jgi:hypothetical protein
MDMTLTINPINHYKKAATIKDDCGFYMIYSAAGVTGVV